jgi:RimJ/RimL family protein N-acetyltransferase
LLQRKNKVVAIPTFETQRLYLRAPRIEDWPQYAEFMQSERSVFFGGPYSTRDAWGVFCHDVALWELVGHGALMLEDRHSGLVLGSVGINAGPLFPEHELGWFVYPSAEGKGYAYEAAKALLDWAGKVPTIKSLVSYIDQDNLRSRRLAERLGARLDETAPGQDPGDLVFRHFGP